MLRDVALKGPSRHDVKGLETLTLLTIHCDHLPAQVEMRDPGTLESMMPNRVRRWGQGCSWTRLGHTA